MLGTRRNLTNLGAIPILVKLLSDRSVDLQILSAETLANVAKIKKGRKFIRKAGGIKLMVNAQINELIYFYFVVFIVLDCTYLMTAANLHLLCDRSTTWMYRIKS